MLGHSNKEEKRDEQFSEKVATKIWRETPSPENSYLTQEAHCHGYDLIALMQKRSFVDVLYLLHRGELPSKNEAELLEKLMIALINPGPRHPATRAAMNAGVGKTDTQHILPIALSIYGGEHIGAAVIEPAMRFIRKNRRKAAQEVADALLSSAKPAEEGDWHIAPGFGSRYNGIDPMPAQFAQKLLSLAGAGDALRWGDEFAQALAPNGMGWLNTGIAAAVFTDLGFSPRAGAGLFQTFAAPGLLAHAVELSGKPITAMPFPKDEDYVIEYQK